MAVMTRDEVETAVRAWARRSPLLPLGFAQSMRILGVRDAELPSWVARSERPRATVATIEYGDRDYEVAIVGDDVHVHHPPRAWLRIALIAGLLVTGLGLIAARLLASPQAVEAPVRATPPAVVEPAERTVLCPGCDGKGCAACGDRGRIAVPVK